MQGKYIKSLRPQHWIKSGFCLAALFVSREMVSAESWGNAIPLLVIFSLISSAGYVVNDIVNREEDRFHPRKSKRPIASGALSMQRAILLAALLYVGSGITGGVLYGFNSVMGCLFGYVGLNLCYTFVLRKIVFVDIIAISFGFVLRVMAGAYVIDIPPSEWLMGLTYFLALLLGLGKRRGELQVVENGEISLGQTRTVLKWYEGDLSSFAIVLVGISIIVAYCLYCVVVQGGFPFVFSAVPVGVAVFSYIREAGRSESVETPENMVLKQSVLVMSFITWVVLVSYFIYIGG